jgi:hypothetical protein
VLVFIQAVQAGAQLAGPNYAAQTPVGSPVSVNFTSFQLGSNDIPLNEPPLARTVGIDDPEQIHITLGGGHVLHAHV